MKTHIHNPLPLTVLIVVLGLLLTNRVTGQTYTNLYRFSRIGVNPQGAQTNSDGAIPGAGLVLSGNTFYGTTEYGGTNGIGTVFALNIDGTGGSTTLHDFTGRGGPGSVSGLILSGNTLYGTTQYGGSASNGVVFALNTNGMGFTNLYSFTATSGALSTNGDGAGPVAGLILSGNTLYGTAASGGTNGSGTVFALNTNGMGFTVLHTFTATSTNLSGVSTNHDGYGPATGLLLSGNTLYGTAEYGGTNGTGTVFAMNTNGTGFTVLHGFTAPPTSYPHTNSDGAAPLDGLVLSGNTLFGGTELGGTNGTGTIFALNTNGMDFTTLHFFGPANANNTDGLSPDGGLVLSGNILYGNAGAGSSQNLGTLFALTTQGAGFTVLHAFYYATNDGAIPQGELIFSGNTLYGTTSDGGTDSGVVFSLSIPQPQLALLPSGTNVVLSWPTNAFAFTLQFATNLVPPDWSNVSPGPFDINTSYVVTNTRPGAQQFFRLVFP